MLKNYCHICNQRPPVYQTARFRPKIGFFKFETKNALLGCLGQQFRKTILISEIGAPRLALLQNLVQKIKSFLFGTKNARFETKNAKFESARLSYLKSAPSNLSNCKIS